MPIVYGLNLINTIPWIFFLTELNLFPTQLNLPSTPHGR